MMTITRFTADVLPDGTIRPPKEIQLEPGTVDVIVFQQALNGGLEKKRRTSLADWAEDNAEHWGDRLSAENVSKFTGRGE